LLGLVEDAHGLVGDLIHRVCRRLRELGAERIILPRRFTPNVDNTVDKRLPKESTRRGPSMLREGRGWLTTGGAPKVAHAVGA
jgi:hypothetical protein